MYFCTLTYNVNPHINCSAEIAVNMIEMILWESTGTTVDDKKYNRQGPRTLQDFLPALKRVPMGGL